MPKWSSWTYNSTNISTASNFPSSSSVDKGITKTVKSVSQIFNKLNSMKNTVEDKENVVPNSLNESISSVDIIVDAQVSTFDDCNVSSPFRCESQQSKTAYISPLMIRRMKIEADQKRSIK